MKNKGFVKGALILIIFNLIGKVVGAVYRIPLAKILGSAGMGQYQLAFPLYCLLLTVSTSSLPIAISKLVAEYNAKQRFSDSKKVLWISVIVLFFVSLISTAVMIFGAKPIAGFQGNKDAYICYYGIAPAILFVGLLSAFRGFFQGNLCMYPTAISGLIEQVAKMFFGLFFARKFIEIGVSYAVFGALLGVSISEFFAFLFLIICYFCYTKNHRHLVSVCSCKNKVLAKQLFNLSIPITLGGMISPLTTMIDSVLVVNLLIYSGFSASVSTSLLGISSGVIEPLVNIPVVISVSISTALLPSISKLQGEDGRISEIQNIIEKAFQITLSISLAFAICFVIFGSQILNFLYSSSFDQAELMVALKLLFIGSFNIIFLSLVQVSSGVLQGLGKPKWTVVSLCVGGAIKLIFDAVLVVIPSINILGALISGGACYFATFALNYKKIRQITNAKAFKYYFWISIQECLVAVVAYFVNILCLNFFGSTVSLIISGGLSVLVFFVTYYMFFLKSKAQPIKTATLT